MYMSTYIRNKNCHQYSYGFQNFMSSWGSWSKISKLQPVGDVSFFRSKGSLFFSPTLHGFPRQPGHFFTLHPPILACL